MKAKEIRDLIDFISQSGLDEVNIETEEFKISVKKNAAPAAPQVVQPVQVAAAPAPQAAPSQPKPAAEPAAKPNKYIEIKAPMIGTFYKAANPESAPFVSVGDTIKKGDPVCIIEAMKLFNEIESEVSGRIVEILVDDATPVEYDQPLYLVDPS